MHYQLSEEMWLKRVDFPYYNTDLVFNKTLIIVKIYRSFNPPNNIPPKTFSVSQLSFIIKSLTKTYIFMGNLNLDWNMKSIQRCQFRKYFDDMDSKLGDFNLVQIV
jgi:hypothetical protein